jgi:hypothetical protein
MKDQPSAHQRLFDEEEVCVTSILGVDGTYLPASKAQQKTGVEGKSKSGLLFGTARFQQRFYGGGKNGSIPRQESATGAKPLKG